MKFRIIDLPYNYAAELRRFLAALVLLFVVVPSGAAEHLVTSSTSTVNCRTFAGGVKPGDTITLAAGNRGPLTITNCFGQSGNPIIVRNDSTGDRPTVIRRTSASSGGFIFTCKDCVHVVIDGTAKWNGAPKGAYCGAPAGTNGCGIKITSIASNDSPTSFLRLNGLTTKVVVRGIEIDGRMSDLSTTGVGIHQNDAKVMTADHPGFWREDFVYEKNYIHNVYGEGMYIGPNWSEPDLRVPLRNITIRENLVEDTGRDNIQLKSAIRGTNRIHHNVVRRSGLRNEGAMQGAGISVTEGGRNLKIYNNWVEASGVQGIQHYNRYVDPEWGPFNSEIFNNVVNDTGRLGGANSNGHGITVANKDGSADTVTAVYNNTIVRTAQDGINFGSRIADSLARDNIVTAWGTTALSVGANKSTNNRVGTISSMKFVDASNRNFALAADSPARNAGGSTGFPPDDFLRIARPQGGQADQGAFEFSTSAVAAPKPPDISNVK